MAEETAALPEIPAPETTPPTTETAPKAEGAPLLAQQPEASPAEPEKPAEPEAAPDYSQLKFAEGFVANEEALGKFREIAGEAKVSPEAAQKLIDLYTADKQAEAQAWAKTVQTWRSATESDPYLTGGQLAQGGFADMKDALAAANRGIERFADKELRDLLSDPELGLGNHPALVRYFAKVGREFREPALAEGVATQSADPLRSFYPSMHKD